jgi:uncharacterized MnhB-related membrane protein
VTALQVGALALIALGAPVVALTRDPLRQALCLGPFGISLAVLFFVFQAPDVALSQIVVSAVGLPVIVLMALTKIREEEEAGERE